MLRWQAGCYTRTGALYSTGADPIPPGRFGYHEVFHAYVCAAAACQYVAIALFLTSQG